MRRELHSIEAPQYRPAQDGHFYDEKGNTIDKDGNLIKEAPSAELIEARRLLS